MLDQTSLWLQNPITDYEIEIQTENIFYLINIGIIEITKSKKFIYFSVYFNKLCKIF